MLKSKLLALFLSLATLTSLAACGSDNTVTPAPTPDPTPSPATSFAKGADVSWLTQLESEGQKFYDQQGNATECMALLKNQCGVNAIRLRVWMNPADKWNSMQDVLVKARRAHQLGLRLMIDFHFSDTWADPGHQLTPSAWASYDLAQLKTAVADHVKAMLTLLKSEGISPEWVQIGNETRGGMLYPLGAIDKENNFAQLLNAGYDAVKQVAKDAKVIVHLDAGENLGIYTYLFDNLQRYGGKYDLIGMSLYPDATNWQTMANQCVANMTQLHTRYGKSIMLCEIGMHYQQAKACHDCIATIMREGQAKGHLEGIFYWEPEAPAGYNGGYDKGCFDKGVPTEAIKAFKE